MRTLPLLLLLTACDGERVSAPEAPRGAMIQCALDGADIFEPACTVARTARGTGVVLTLSGPDGRFRRMLATADGAGIVAADGAEPVIVADGPAGEIEVRIAGDRYRLPAARP